MSAPSISVVMPVYNGAAHLAQAIESVLAQTLPPARVVVVDDGSTDGSAALLQRYGDRITRLSQTNHGQAHARRTGADAAGGELIAFIDQDDVWDADKLARQADLMQRFPDAGATYCDHRRIDADGRLLATTGSGYGLRGSGRILDALLRGNFILSASLVMIRRSTYEAAGGFLPQRGFWADDYSLWLRTAAHAPIVYQAETLVSYRQHAHNTSGDRYEQARGDIQALEELCAHLQSADMTQALPAARRALRDARIGTAMLARQRGEWRQALRHRVAAWRT
ncbi:MAG: glycosyltransferase [Methyloversatilis sp.]|jgi:glycosyltransferase involved in cell wall biosynthesis|nr:glycosyltransferase [Methyloversatilis sp.]